MAQKERYSAVACVTDAAIEAALRKEYMSEGLGQQSSTNVWFRLLIESGAYRLKLAKRLTLGEFTVLVPKQKVTGQPGIAANRPQETLKPVPAEAAAEAKPGGGGDPDPEIRDEVRKQRGRQPGRRGDSKKKCYNCGRLGHIAVMCPEEQKTHGRAGQSGATGRAEGQGPTETDQQEPAADAVGAG
jgi:hypothetical protein